MRKRLPCLLPLILMAADMTAIIVSILIALGVLLALGGHIPAMVYMRLLPVLALFPLVFGALGLYPGVLLSPPEEIKKLCWGISLVFLALGAVTFVSRDGHLYSRFAFLGSWLLSIVLAPMGRAAARSLLMHKHWWGHPVVIFGLDDAARMLLNTLRLRPRVGLRPLAVWPCDGEAKGAESVEGVPVVHDRDEALDLGEVEHSYAAVSGACLKSARNGDLLDQLARRFKHVIILPMSVGHASLWVTVLDVDGLPGLLVRHNLLDGKRLAMKRFLDLTLTLLGGIVVLPVCLLIALLIRLESKGPALFKQRRIGLNGEAFHVWKFRTMVQDAEKTLGEHLARDPELKREWDSCQKLRRDPRVTRMGRFLRCTSLDELPQLVNVLRGELSLVGPRPIIEAEVGRYRESFAQYTRVKPGMTGLWQISGRNLVSYDRRIDLDTYYINNWSIWFDIYILAKTIPVVLTRHGAC